MEIVEQGNVFAVGDSIRWGIHSGPVTRVAFDGETYFLEFERTVGANKVRRTWIRETEAVAG